MFWHIVVNVMMFTVLCLPEHTVHLRLGFEDAADNHSFGLSTGRCFFCVLIHIWHVLVYQVGAVTATLC